MTHPPWFYNGLMISDDANFNNAFDDFSRLHTNMNNPLTVPNIGFLLKADSPISALVFRSDPNPGC
jgi:hypothetical protein